MCTRWAVRTRRETAAQCASWEALNPARPCTPRSSLDVPDFTLPGGLSHPASPALGLPSRNIALSETARPGFGLGALLALPLGLSGFRPVSVPQASLDAAILRSLCRRFGSAGNLYRLLRLARSLHDLVTSIFVKPVADTNVAVWGRMRENLGRFGSPYPACAGSDGYHR